MLALILKFLGPIISGPLVEGALKAYQAKLSAGNTSERIAADIATRELAVEQREREVAADVLMSEQGNWFTRWVRPMWAAPFVIWTWKVVVWDVCLGWGSTPELKGMVGNLCITVAGAYFGGRTIENVARIIKK